MGYGPSAVHFGVICDVSGMSPIIGPRYHKRNEDYDLCEAEFLKLTEEAQRDFVCIERPESKFPGGDKGKGKGKIPGGAKGKGKKGKGRGGLCAAEEFQIGGPPEDANAWTWEQHLLTGDDWQRDLEWDFSQGSSSVSSENCLGALEIASLCPQSEPEKIDVSWIVPELCASINRRQDWNP